MPLETHPVNTIGIEGIQGARILLVEDHKINQQVAVAILMQVGVVVEVAGNGREGVDRLKAVADRTEPFFDAVLMDIEMPVMDGLEATRRIREWKAQSSKHKVAESVDSPETFPHPGSVPIIAMTAHAMEEHRKECLATGMNDFIAKPIDERELYKALIKWIKPAQREIPPPFTPEKMAVELWDDIPEDIPGIDLKTALA
ncbi:MAG: response regulator, partial [Gammaproteobacteria bacterium]|nr:response regulator [Gammaproteobacteria bacterium]